MKVLHLIQKPQLRGAEVFASQLSSHLQKAGHEAIVVCVFDGTATLPFDGKIYHLNADQRRRFTDVKAWKRLNALIKQEKPDIIQANAGDTLKYAVFSKLFFNWKQPIVFRNASMISLYIKSSFIKAFNAFLFAKTKAVISVSNSSAQDFVKLFPAVKKNIVTIPVGIETNKIPTLNRDSNPALQGAPALVHVGGFSFEKNHTGLINIFERILQRLPNTMLHLVGDGPLRQQTEELVQQKGLSKQVVFHGFQKQPLSFISQADALLLPSIIEGLPGVVLEAFYCKTPVVAYDAGGIGEIVINDKTGFLIPKNDEAAFAKATIAVINNDEQKNRFTSNAYELVTTQYLNRDLALRFVNAYHRVIGKEDKSAISVTGSAKNVMQNDCV